MRELNASTRRILEEAEREQEALALDVVMEDGPNVTSGIVTGIDVAYKDEIAFACAVRMELSSLTVLETYTFKAQCEFPYITGFFFLREAPLVLGVINKISNPGMLLIDGNGILHPRRCGLASYVGVKLNLPTIGIAKSLLLGSPQRRVEDMALVRDGEEILGCAVWLGEKKKPIYVSIGHQVTLDTAISIAKKLSIHGYPEPLRLAHSCAQNQENQL